MKFRDFLREVRKRFFRAVQQYNDQHAERATSNPRGFNGSQINNKEQIAQAITLLCNEINRKKVGANGVLKITRTFIAYAIDRSVVTVDKYLHILQKLGIIKRIETGLHVFDKAKKAINCLYLTLDLSWFTVEEVKQVVDKVMEVFFGAPAEAKPAPAVHKAPPPPRLRHPAERHK